MWAKDLVLKFDSHKQTFAAIAQVEGMKNKNAVIILLIITLIVIIFIILNLSVIPQVHIGYEMVDSQRGVYVMPSWSQSSHIQQVGVELFN